MGELTFANHLIHTSCQITSFQTWHAGVKLFKLFQTTQTISNDSKLFQTTQTGSKITEETTKGQIDGFSSQFPFKCHLPEVASVGD